MSYFFRLFILVLTLFIVLPSHNAEAVRFRTSYISFELPPNWSCKSNKTEWICFSKYSKKQKEALIIISAKLLGTQDNLTNYKIYLNENRSFHSPSKQFITSNMKHVRDRKIDNITWVDSLHFSSESNIFFTRYIGAKLNNVAAAMTLSAHKSVYTKYSQDFMKAIRSIKVINSKKQPTNLSKYNPKQSGKIGGDISPLLDVDDEFDQLKSNFTENKKMKELIIKGLGFLLLIGSIGLYFYAKK